MKKKRSYTNEEIVAGILSNNKFVIDYCYNQTYITVAQRANRYNMQKADKEDLCHECLTAFWKNCQKEEFQIKEKFTDYIGGIVKNKLTDRYEKRKKSPIQADMGASLENKGLSDDKVWENVETKEQNIVLAQVIVHQLLQNLSFNCQEALMLKYTTLKTEPKITHKELAELLKFKSRGYSEQHLHRCSKQLLKLVSESEQYHQILTAFPNLQKLRRPTKK